MKDQKYKREIYHLLEQKVRQIDIINQTGFSKSTVQKYSKMYYLERKEIYQNKENMEAYKEYDLQINKLYKEYDQIFNALKKIDEIIQDIPNIFNQIGIYDVEQSKLLHEIEDCSNATQLIEIMNQLASIRKQRRLYKHKYFLATRLRYNLQSNKLHSAIFNTIISNMESGIDICKNAVYTPPKPKEYITRTQYNQEHQKDQYEHDHKEDWQQKILEITNKKES